VRTPSAEAADVEHRTIAVECDAVSLAGDLSLPHGAKGLVMFAHGSGSSRLSPRNRYVAETLQEGGLATLLFDLLTPDEERIDVRTRHLRFDIPLLASRLVGATDWLSNDARAGSLPVGYFAASTGAAAALMAAARRPERVAAVVSRGGRPDLAGHALAAVRAPTLLIVGGLDHAVVPMNREALSQLRSEKKLEIVPGATHLFEEPGTLGQVAVLAREWFLRYLVASVADATTTAVT
jgi:pimeloyl-ACP methyl ester carboxylesterase